MKPCRLITEVKGNGQTLQHGNKHPLICNSCTQAPALPERFFKTAIPHRTAKKISWPQKLLELVLREQCLGRHYVYFQYICSRRQDMALAGVIFSVWQQHCGGGGCGLSVGCKNVSCRFGTTKAQQLRLFQVSLYILQFLCSLPSEQSQSLLVWLFSPFLPCVCCLLRYASSQIMVARAP